MWISIFVAVLIRPNCYALYSSLMNKLLNIVLLLIVPILQLRAEPIASPQAEQFIDEMVAKHNFSKQDLQHLFAQTRLSRDILQAISNPAERLPWHRYRLIFLNAARISKGVEFWRENRRVLARAEKIYGVPPQIIVAVIGVETQYGQNLGKNRVMDALATLAFHYPKRSKFFRGELEHFLLLTSEQDLAPLSLYGSYAGAMGIPQFISSSYRHYAVDFDEDKKIDIWYNPVDAIGSVANYFNRHGWQTGQRIAVPAQVNGEQYKALLSDDLKPQIKVNELRQLGFTFTGEISDSALVKVVVLALQDNEEVWLGLDNFYVITRYNKSVLYAMATYQLSELIKKAYRTNIGFHK